MSERDVRKTDLTFTVEWQAKPDQVEALLGIIRRALPLFEREPGAKVIRIHHSMKEPTRFFFYEVFADQAGYEAHLETEHFKTMILQEAVPKLAHRERIQHKIL
jgi:quinol monooxygenase YgiN